MHLKMKGKFKGRVKFWPYRTSRRAGKIFWEMDGSSPDGSLINDFFKLLLLNGNHQSDNHVGFEVKLDSGYFCIHFSDHRMTWSSRRGDWENSASNDNDWEEIK